MNVQLTQAVQDVTGVTGLNIIRAIVAGERDPQKLAALRQPGVKKTEVQIARALTGNYRAEHVFALKQALGLYDTYTAYLRSAMPRSSASSPMSSPSTMTCRLCRPRRRPTRIARMRPATMPGAICTR